MSKKYQLFCMRLRNWGRARFTEPFNSFAPNTKKLIFLDIDIILYLYCRYNLGFKTITLHYLNKNKTFSVLY